MIEGMSHPSSHPWPLSIQHLSIVNDWPMNIQNFLDSATCSVEMTLDFRL
jgi:hypothetical protein